MSGKTSAAPGSDSITTEVNAMVSSDALGLDSHTVVQRSRFTVDVTLRVRPGELISIMGPSGSGKSTVIEALAGLTELSAGHILLDGRTLADVGRRVHVQPGKRTVGLLSQEPDLFPHMTATQNIEFALRASGSERATARAEATGWLEELGLSDLAAHRPAALSGGQRQRVALARALAAKPRLLLLDEPLASLDVEAAADMRDLLRTQLQRHDTVVVLVSHSVQDARALAERMVVLSDGVISQQGTVDEVLQHPANRFATALARSVG